jgi:hypothetical protein
MWKSVGGKLNTWAQEDNGMTSVRLYDTTIVKYNKDTITLNAGSWKTVTTKRRMNQVSDTHKLYFRIFQTKNVWYVNYGEHLHEFENGMELKRNAI